MALKIMAIGSQFTMLTLEKKIKAPEISEKSWLNTKQKPTAKIQAAAGLSQNKSDHLQQSW